MTQLSDQRLRTLATTTSRHLRYLPVTALLLDLAVITAAMVLAVLESH